MKSIKLNEILSNVLKKKFSAFFYTPPLYKDAVSYFFEKPVKSISIKTVKDINNFLKNLNRKKILAYSLIKYEAGYALERSLNKYFREEEDAILINLFDTKSVKKYNSKDIELRKFENNKYKISNYKINTTKSEYIKNIGQIKEYLKDGDTYQVNYTVKSNFDFSGDYISLFESLLFNQSAMYSAFINLGDRILISLSPELFFSVKNKKIKTLPMKGTVKRGANNEEDKRNSKSLKSSAKDKAENLMIVDLLRNDLGKICKYGSVKAKELFSVEKYESLFQMVSKVTGKLKDEISIGDVIKNIFPSGSVTGAPKIRTMEIIKELEKEKRGIYTGVIGIIENEKATFNVAIRTLEIDKKTGEGTMGLGSGIVIDSDPGKEYEEVKLKGKFLREPQKYFELFETMLIQKGKIKDWTAHINRMKTSAEYFLFLFKNEKLNNVKEEVINKVQLDKKYRFKLLLNKYGELNYEVTEYVKAKRRVKIILSEKRISSNNTFQYFKTTNRKIYSDEYQNWQNEDFFDVIFLNEKEELAEGSISNIFIKIKGNWFTPKIESGILNGIERDKLLKENSNIKEAIITFDDLFNAENIMLTNSLKGNTFVKELHLVKGRVIYLSAN
ncbi:MAG: aminodeoxychorismate synthase component I [Bacteroidetes bacterium]|nr:aminodeoxychorismate synthase component I [Bacteroidota bacterium]